MEEVHLEQRHRLAAIGHLQEAVIGEISQNGGLDLSSCRQIQEGLDVLVRHRQGHALLGLRQEDFPGRQAGVFQRCLLEVDPGATRGLGHLAHRGGQSAGPVVGDGRVEAQPTGLEQEVEHHLLRDGIADLHGLGW